MVYISGYMSGRLTCFSQRLTASSIRKMSIRKLRRSTGLRNTTGKEFVDFSFIRETQLIHPVMDVWVEIWQDETSI